MSKAYHIKPKLSSMANFVYDLFTSFLSFPPHPLFYSIYKFI
nr:MAG TPA: hypothetical protein [Caudoviricetes sp.]